MSISLRSLGILSIVVVGLLAWLLLGWATGPRSAAADSFAPFPPERAGSAMTQPAAFADGQPAEADGSQEQPFGVSAAPLVFDTSLSSLLTTRPLTVSEGPSFVDLSREFVVAHAAPKWLADSNGDGELNEADIDDFGDLWSWADPRADFNADGIVDPDDYAAFVEAYDSRGTHEQTARVYFGRELTVRSDVSLGEASLILRIENINDTPSIPGNGR